MVEIIDSGTSEFLEELLIRIREYLASPQDLVKHVPAASLQKVIDTNLPLEGLGLENALNDIDQFLKYSVKTNLPGFMNPLWGGFNLSAFAGEVVATLANNSMYTYELSPFATLVEQALIQRMCEIVGFGDFSLRVVLFAC